MPTRNPRCRLCWKTSVSENEYRRGRKGKHRVRREYGYFLSAIFIIADSTTPGKS